MFLNGSFEGPLDKVHTFQLQNLIGLELAKTTRMDTNRIKNIMEHLGWKKGRPTIDGKRMRGYIRMTSDAPTTKKPTPSLTATQQADRTTTNFFDTEPHEVSEDVFYKPPLPTVGRSPNEDDNEPAPFGLLPTVGRGGL